ncbi:MAG: hypothetical protein DRJ30_04320 [Candidatus Methanomethylicota archaeon]|nr:MAG: hypothetical protein DRJ30_04320 [Candidatus Verstraetearchaeota archaeon]
MNIQTYFSGDVLCYLKNSLIDIENFDLKFIDSLNVLWKFQSKSDENIKFNECFIHKFRVVHDYAMGRNVLSMTFDKVKSLNDLIFLYAKLFDLSETLHSIITLHVYPWYLPRNFKRLLRKYKFKNVLGTLERSFRGDLTYRGFTFSIAFYDEHSFIDFIVKFKSSNDMRIFFDFLKNLLNMPLSMKLMVYIRSLRNALISSP